MIREQKRKKLIVLPGNLTSAFFVNEIPYFQREFDKVTVIAFGKLGKEERQVIERFHLDCHFCSLRQLRLKHILYVIRWMQLSYVKKEIKTYVSFSKNGLKRFAYLIFYGIYHIITEPMLLQEINHSTDMDIYLYAFWMSRAAYCVAASADKYPHRVVKICTRAHGYDLYQERNQTGYLPFRRFLAEKLDAVYFISKDGKSYFEEMIEDRQLSCICDRKLSYLGTRNKDNLQKVAVPKNKVVIASCSSVIDIKRLDLIIELMEYLIKHLSEKGIKVYWIHIGDGKQIKDVKRQCTEKLKKGCYRLLGKVDNAIILKTYIKYDVDYFINLSDSEGVPVSIMEAMSLGLPVIARNVGGNREIVNTSNGLLLSEPLPKGWKAQVCEWLQKNYFDKDSYSIMQANAREMWDKNYNADRNYPQFFKDMCTGVQRNKKS